MKRREEGKKKAEGRKEKEKEGRENGREEGNGPFVAYIEAHNV